MVDKKTREILEIVAAFGLAWLGYQALAYAAGTPLPVVSVVSDSMYHQQAGFENWWETRKDFYTDNGITRSEFLQFSFRNGLSRGDLLVVLNARPEIGDVIIYNRNGISIVHRVVVIEKNFYVTKGDNNIAEDKPIAQKEIQGKVVFAVPLLGYPRYLLFELFRI